MDVLVLETSTVMEGHLFGQEKSSYPYCHNETTVTDILQFNFSEYDYPGVGGGPWPPPLGPISALKITFCIINMIISILGNCAVIVAVYHNPALRSTINFYLVKMILIRLIRLSNNIYCCKIPHGPCCFAGASEPNLRCYRNGWYRRKRIRPLL